MPSRNFCSAFSRWLSHVAVEGRSREAAVGEVFANALRLALGPSEDEDAADILSLQDARDNLWLVHVVCLEDELRRRRNHMVLVR